MKTSSSHPVQFLFKTQNKAWRLQNWQFYCESQLSLTLIRFHKPVFSCEGLLLPLSLQGCPVVHRLQASLGLTFGMATCLSGLLVNAAIYVLWPDGETTVLLEELCSFPQGATGNVLQVDLAVLVTLSVLWPGESGWGKSCWQRSGRGSGQHHPLREGNLPPSAGTQHVGIDFLMIIL